jgi:hypothetical protein
MFYKLKLWLYVAVYIYKSYNKGGFNSASVGVTIVLLVNMHGDSNVTFT